MKRLFSLFFVLCLMLSACNSTTFTDGTLGYQVQYPYDFVDDYRGGSSNTREFYDEYGTESFFISVYENVDEDYYYILDDVEPSSTVELAGLEAQRYEFTDGSALRLYTEGTVYVIDFIDVTDATYEQVVNSFQIN